MLLETGGKVTVYKVAERAELFASGSVEGRN